MAPFLCHALSNVSAAAEAALFEMGTASANHRMVFLEPYFDTLNQKLMAINHVVVTTFGVPLGPCMSMEISAGPCAQETKVHLNRCFFYS